MSYINKIQKGATEYDINDTRIPTPIANKILGTDNNGAMEWQDAPASGAQNYIEFEVTETISGIPDIEITQEQYELIASDEIQFLKIVENFQLKTYWFIKKNEGMFLYLNLENDTLVSQEAWVSEESIEFYQRNQYNLGSLGGTQLYKHLIQFEVEGDPLNFELISTSSTQAVDLTSLDNLINSAIVFKAQGGNDTYQPVLDCNFALQGNDYDITVTFVVSGEITTLTNLTSQTMVDTVTSL